MFWKTQVSVAQAEKRVRAAYRSTWMIGTWLFVLMQIPFAEAQPAQDQVLARVAGREITVAQFKDEYIDYLLKTGIQDQPGLRKSMMENLIANEMMVASAEERGIRQTPDYRNWELKVRRKLGIEAYTKDLIFKDIAVSEPELEEAFLRANTTYKASHLYARTEEAANRLYARLQRGEAWNVLAKEVFTDTTLANHGGSIGAFGFDEMDPAFEKAAFRMKIGEVSKPVRTEVGYSIIRLDDKFTKPLRTETEYANMKTRLETFVLNQKRTEARRAHVASLENKLNVVFNSASMTRLGQEMRGAAQPQSKERPELWMQKPLVTFGTGTNRRTWTVQQFREVAERFTTDRQRGEIRDLADLKAFIRGLVIQDEMVRAAKQLHLDETPLFTNTLSQNMKEWVVREEVARIGRSIQVSPDSVRAYYDRNKNHLFSEEKVQVSEILVASLEEAKRLRTDLTETNFGNLARLYSQRPGASETDGDLGFVTRKELGKLAEAVWAAKKGDVLGPQEIGGRYVILKVGDKMPNLPLGFEQAKPMLERQLWLDTGGREMRQVRSALENRYRKDIYVNEQLLLTLNLKEKNPQ